MFKKYVSECASIKFGTNLHGCCVSSMHRVEKLTYLMYRLSTHRLRTTLHTDYELFCTSFFKLETFQHLVSQARIFSALRHWFVLLIYYRERPTSE